MVNNAHQKSTRITQKYAMLIGQRISLAGLLMLTAVNYILHRLCKTINERVIPILQIMPEQAHAEAMPIYMPGLYSYY